MNNHQFSLLVFDFDGTLVETRTDIAVSVNYVREQLGLHLLDPKIVETYIGDGIHLLIGRAIYSDDPERIETAISHFRDHYWDHCMDKSYVYPGVIDCLDRFKRVFHLAIASNKREDFTRRMIDGYNLDKYFTTIIGGDSLAHKKPAPEVLQHIMKIYDTVPDKTIMIGDSETDINAGKNAAVTTVGVSFGIGNREKLLASSPDYMIDHFDELINIVENKKDSGL